MRYYAGIGSRKTPPEILQNMKVYASVLEEKGYTLRSGGAVGADIAFEAGVGKNKEIFLSQHAVENYWTYNEVTKYIPSDRNKSGFRNWNPHVKNLLARNMLQILGKDRKTLVDFVVCWTPSLDYTDSSAGGTGWAIRCALAHKITVFNLFSEEQREQFESLKIIPGGTVL